MEERSSFYSDLYHENSSNEILIDSFLKNVYIPKLTEAQKEKCEEKLTVNCLQFFKIFSKKKKQHPEMMASLWSFT